MGTHRIEVISRPVDIARHGGQKPGAILTVVRPAHFDTGYLRQSICTIARLQGPGKQIFLLDWLWGQLGVNAARPKEQQPLYSTLVTRIDLIGLDLEIISNEFRRASIVGENPTHLCRGKEYVLRTLLAEEIAHCFAIRKIHFRMRSQQ